MQAYPPATTDYASVGAQKVGVAFAVDNIPEDAASSETAPNYNRLFVGLCANNFRNHIQSGDVNKGQADNYTEAVLSESMLVYGMHVHRYQGDDAALLGIVIEPVAKGAIVDDVISHFDPEQKPPELSVRFSPRGTIEYANNGVLFHEADAPADTGTKLRPCVFFGRISQVEIENSKGTVDDPDEIESNQMQIGQLRWVFNDDFDSTAAAAIATRFGGVDDRNGAIEATAAANLKALTEAVDAEEAARKAEVSGEEKRAVRAEGDLAAKLNVEESGRLANDSAIRSDLADAVDSIAENAAAAEATRVKELGDNANADAGEKARAQKAEQTLTANLDAHDAANVESFAQRDATIATLQNELDAEEVARKKHINETKEELNEFIESVRNSAQAARGEQYTKVTDEREGAITGVQKELNSTDVKLTAADTAAAAVLNTVNKTLNAQDAGEKARAQKAEQTLTANLDAHDAANVESFAQRDATIATLQNELDAEEVARKKHINETKEELNEFIESVRNSAQAARGEQYTKVTDEREGAITGVQKELNSTDVKLTAADTAAAAVLNTVNKTLNAQDGALGDSLATAVGDSQAADAHLHVVVDNLTNAVAENHEAAANSLDVAITALDAFHTERVDNRTAEHREQFGNHSWYLSLLHNRSIATNEDVADLMAAMALADATLANATDLLRSNVERADEGLQNETERVEGELITFKLVTASQYSALVGQHEALKTRTASEVSRLEAALATARRDLEAVLNETNAQISVNAMDAEASRSVLASTQTEAEKELPTFLAVTAIVSTVVSILVSIIVSKCSGGGGGGGGSGGWDAGKYDSPDFVVNKAYDPASEGQDGEGHVDVDESTQHSSEREDGNRSSFADAGFVVDKDAKSFRRQSVKRINPLMLDESLVDGATEGYEGHASVVDAI